MHVQQNDKFSLYYNSNVQRKMCDSFLLYMTTLVSLLSAHLLVEKGKKYK